MGQQQLLLLVLGIVSVGLAVVVGINAFGENDKKANADAMVTDALRIASDAQAWDLKPGQFGGSQDNEDLSDLATNGFQRIGYPVSTGGSYVNINATYVFSASNSCSTDPATYFTGSQTVEIYVVGNNTDRLNRVCVAIAGTRATDIATSIDYDPS